MKHCGNQSERKQYQLQGSMLPVKRVAQGYVQQAVKMWGHADVENLELLRCRGTEVACGGLQECR